MQIVSRFSFLVFLQFCPVPPSTSPCNNICKNHIHDCLSKCMSWQESNMTQRRLTLMVGWWTSDIATAAASDNARPLMEGGVGTWHQQLCEAASNTAHQADMATAEEAVKF